MSENAKNPGMALRVLYVSTAGRKIVKVVPEGEKVSIGKETWKVNHTHRFPGAGKFDAICVQGRTEALSPWGSSPLTPEEFDATAHNNLLEQIHSISKGGKTAAVNWLQLGGIGLVLLCVVGFGWSINSSVDEIGKDLKASHAAFFAPKATSSPNDGVVVVHASENPSP